MPAALTSIPETLTAGETIDWLLTYSEFPATGYTLKIALQIPGTATIVTLTATASGSAHAVNVVAATTAAYVAGVYIATVFAEAGAARHLVERRSLSILPSPLAALGTSHATRTLTLIETAIEGRIPRGLENTNIDGQQIDRIPIADLHRLRDRYRREVAMERDAANARAGVPVRRTIGIRFTNS